ncbi:hypothetical protein [Paractinoplanes toevensis]|uniref:Uncharacterized protein n=1 Tax=Paractinoplanes toevensis TaxID=571911 RepID=A0A919TE83_9ACTN|nr:hypothetical protein [Actinoplanes toevensis]GIM94374.1 hypothetical protein Ato02nite_061670 [Actinoplanes toevensis]
MTTTNRSITEALAAVRDAAERARAGTLDPQATREALLDAAALITLLDLRAFPLDGDDTREQVVVTVHGVDVSVRGRSRDLFVHVEDIRDDRDQQTLPLSVEVNNAGEMTYGQGWDTAPLCEGCWDLPAVDLTLMRCASCLGRRRRS